MNMLLTLLLGLLTVVGCAPGPLPLPDLNVLPNPNINADFSVAEKLHVTLAFRDAQFMAVAAYEAATIDNEIYLKYFPQAVSWTARDPSEIVRAVFKSIFGGQLDGCGKTLEDVVFSKDFDVPGLGYTCTPVSVGGTINYASPDPTIILCPNAMLHGVVGRSTLPRLPGLPLPVTCSTIGDGTSWRMNTLGSIFVHEWTHINHLVGHALGSAHRRADGTDDQLIGQSIYGCIQTQQIANSENALYIADSYAMFANEAFWSKRCAKTFSRPGPGDDQDPQFQNTPGTEAHPIPGP